jgi:hypothetical protein
MSYETLSRYYSPPELVAALFKHLPLKGRSIYEPCAGGCNLARTMRFLGAEEVITADVDTGAPTDFHRDFMVHDMGNHDFDALVTNFPYKVGNYKVEDFVRRALDMMKGKPVATVLNSAFLEPIESRLDLLVKRRPMLIINMPKISFTGDNKKGWTHSIWAVWQEDYKVRSTEVVWVSERELKSARSKLPAALLEAPSWHSKAAGLPLFDSIR